MSNERGTLAAERPVLVVLVIVGDGIAAVVAMERDTTTDWPGTFLRCRFR